MNYTTYRDIDNLQPACSTNKVIANNRRTLNAGVGPSLRVWIGNIESCDSYSKDLVGGSRNISLDRFFIGIAENRGHDELTIAPGGGYYGEM